MINYLRFLGSGGSMGIPVVGCSCDVCLSDSPFNKRLRPAVLVTYNQKKIWIDTGPDFRQQALHHRVNKLDGVILTHAHHDHTAGIDELRVFEIRDRKPIPILLNQSTANDLRVRYAYLFEENPQFYKLLTRLELHILDASSGEIYFLGEKIRYMTYEQAGMEVNGFCFGSLAYLSDIRNYKEDIFSHLQEIKTLVISAAKFIPSSFHFSVDEAVEFAKKTSAERVWLTHICHELDYEKTNAYLPANIRLAYDGLEITF